MSPLGGVTILWNENSPADVDSAGAGAGEIRSDKTSIRNAVGSEHNWPSGGGPATGYHLLGSARAFVAAQSLVSSSGTDGRLMVTSDTSRLFHVGSAGTMYLGGQNDLSVGSSPVGGQQFYWATEFGVAQSAGNGHVTVTFPNSGYSGSPFVMVAAQDTGAASLPLYVNIQGVPGKTTFTVETFNNGAQASSVTFHWFSIGTRTF